MSFKSFPSCRWEFPESFALYVALGHVCIVKSLELQNEEIGSITNFEPNVNRCALSFLLLLEFYQASNQPPLIVHATCLPWISYIVWHLQPQNSLQSHLEAALTYMSGFHHRVSSEFSQFRQRGRWNRYLSTWDYFDNQCVDMRLYHHKRIIYRNPARFLFRKRKCLS